MAKINYKFYDGKDIYNDGDVEEELLNYYKNNEDIDFYKEGIFYLTTDIRANIINWYPFKKSDEILEIGCGCGTITETLCKDDRKVTAIEASKRRAEITYYRHKNKKKLEVIVGNINDIKMNKKFDYVIIIGVFEYAKRFINDQNPFDRFLQIIKSYLKPNGKVLLAIENRYGIKYWAGANEDHLNMPYVGLEGYDNYDIQTFGQKEFIDLINKNGYENYKFYYPFPDYKMPNIIYTDEHLPNDEEIGNISTYVYGNNINFNINNTLKGIAKNKELGFFSNSFLIEFGLKSSTMSNVIYVKNSTSHYSDYKITTVEINDKQFYKIGNSKIAEKNLDKMINIHNKIKKNDIKVCNIYKKKNLYFSETIEGKSIINYLNELINDNKFDLIQKELDKIVNFYYSISNYKSFENPIDNNLVDIYNAETYILKLSLIDGNISNIIINENNEYVFIDQEAISEKELPADYLIYYSLSYIFGVISNIKKYYSFDDILKKYNINENKIKIFQIIENNYYSNNNIVDFKKKEILESCKKSNNNIINKWTVIYYDNGDGFNENNKIVKKYDTCSNNCYEVTFDIPSNVKNIRFDPLIGGNDLYYFEDVKVNLESIQYDEYNINYFNNKKTLTSDYPYIVFPFNQNQITISVFINPFSNEDIKQFVKEKNHLKEIVESKLK